MQQIDGDLFAYSAKPTEMVSIEITPTGVGNLAAVNIDGVAKPKATTYSFPINRPLGQEHDVVIEFDFPGITDPHARYDVKLTSTLNGAASGGPFSFSVTNDDPLKTASFSITVV